MRTNLVTSTLLTALAAAGIAAAPAAAAEGDAWSVTDPLVTPVLADYPYDPVLEGPDWEGGDPTDCSITGYENRADASTALRNATGCGGVLMQVTIAGADESAQGLATMSATATTTYGCVHPKTGRSRVVSSRTSEVHGRWGTFEIPLVSGTAGGRLYAYHLFPLETVQCRGVEQPAQLSITVTDLVVSIEPFDQPGPTETQALPGSWDAQLALPEHPRNKRHLR